MKRVFSILLALCLSMMAFPALSEEEATDPTIEEGYVTELEGYTSEVRWCTNGDKSIFGRFYYPAGFDASKTYPVVIMSHGMSSTADLTERSGWPEAVTAQGYVGYAFDFCGGSPFSRSDGDYMQMSVRTEQSDLSAVMDFVKAQPFTDSEHLFLLGQSLGGFVTAITAAARPEEVKAVILLYPAFSLVDNLHTSLPSLDDLTGDTFESARGPLGAIFARDGYDIDVMSEIANYTGDVMIIHGINDIIVPYSYSVDAVMQAYAGANSELVLITGKKAAHSFEMVFKEGRIYAQQQGVAFLNAHLD